MKFVSELTGLVCAAAVILCCASGTASAAAQSGPRVTVTGGEIEGRLLPSSGGAVFKGIPLSQPPEGELRWREPMPVKPWTGVRQTVEFAVPCAQGGNDHIAATSKEDCLYLNVRTPDWPAKSRKPVMYLLYGGANVGGSAIGGRGIEPEFDGANFARHGVVVVSINYRLGILRFIGHPELTAGAQNLTTLTTSPLTKGLIHRAI